MHTKKFQTIYNMKTLHYSIIGVLLLYSTIGCNKDSVGIYPHQGDRDIYFNKLQFDTLIIESDEPSLSGEWVINNNRLFYNDYIVTALLEFDTLGNYIDNRIKHGRAANEWTSPFVTVTFHDTSMYSIDFSWRIHCYNNSFYREKQPVEMLHDIPYSNSDWNNLLNNPDVNVAQMYEYNFDTRDLLIYNDALILPVVTEHIKYNGFYINAQAESFWRDSYIFMEIDKENFSTLKLFGHYPHIYSTKNIPVFSIYSFDKFKEELIVSFNADSLIYCYNKDGEVTNTFGYSSKNIKDNYPETYTYEEFQDKRKQQRKSYGYYSHLSVVGNYIFRTYKSEGQDNYGIQIYHDKNLIGDIQTTQEAYVIGEINGTFYAALPADIENECYQLLKFRIPNE